VCRLQGRRQGGQRLSLRTASEEDALLLSDALGLDVRRQEFVWLFRRYSGRQAIRFTYGMKAGGIAFALLALWSLAIWVMELGAGYRGT
jgi:hypothetical protein